MWSRSVSDPDDRVISSEFVANVNRSEPSVAPGSCLGDGDPSPMSGCLGWPWPDQRLSSVLEIPDTMNLDVFETSISDHVGGICRQRRRRVSLVSFVVKSRNYPTWDLYKSINYYWLVLLCFIAFDLLSFMIIHIYSHSCNWIKSKFRLDLFFCNDEKIWLHLI